MGWSCAWDAGKTMDKWTAFCAQSTGSSNTYTENGESYFWETSNREHADGAITGKVFKMVGENLCIPVSTFKINPDGTVARAPKALKDAAR